MVVGGGDAHGFFEVAGEVVDIFKAALVGYLADVELAGVQKINGVEEAQVHQVLVERETGALLDDTAYVVGVETEFFGDILVGERELVVGMDIVDDFVGCFLTVNELRRFKLTNAFYQDIGKHTADFQFVVFESVSIFGYNVDQLALEFLHFGNVDNVIQSCVFEGDMLQYFLGVKVFTDLRGNGDIAVSVRKSIIKINRKVCNRLCGGMKVIFYTGIDDENTSFFHLIFGAADFNDAASFVSIEETGIIGDVGGKSGFGVQIKVSGVSYIRFDVG